MKKIISSILVGACIVNLQAEDNTIESLNKLTKTIKMIEKYYVDDIKINDIVNKATSGLLQNLDAHSAFLDEKALKDIQISTKGEFGGLGIQVGMRDGALTIIAPIENTPADKAGIKAGDIILKINSESALGLSLDEAISRMRGKPKTKINLTIVRKGEDKPLDFTMVRDIIKAQSVYSRLIENENALYIRVASFDRNVEPDVKKIITKNKNVKGIILDLRNNPGGLLDQAVKLVDLFVDQGIIVSQKGKNKSENAIYNASKDSSITKLPLVVIVNGGSASASEIVSGSLQDNKRAVIIGEKTFGKGSVQQVIPVDRLEALKLTVARYYLPSGRTIQAKGVIPDIEVFAGKVPKESENFSLKEKDLKAHLQGELEKISNDKDKAENKDIVVKDKKDFISKEQINNDIQLKTAIDTIKILKIQERL